LTPTKKSATREADRGRGTDRNELTEIKTVSCMAYGKFVKSTDTNEDYV